MLENNQTDLSDSDETHVTVGAKVENGEQHDKFLDYHLLMSSCKRRFQPSGFGSEAIKKNLLKLILGILFADMTYSELECRTFPFAASAHVDETRRIDWYSYPILRNREPESNIPLLGFVDSHHILTNIRTTVCTTGIPYRGIRKEAWEKVATEVQSMVLVSRGLSRNK